MLPKILIIDDCSMKREKIIKCIHKNFGEFSFDIDTAHYANQGMNKVNTVLKNNLPFYDFIFCDMNMPILSDTMAIPDAGLRVLSKFKRYEKRFDFKILDKVHVISSSETLKEDLEAIRLPDVPYVKYSSSSSSWHDAICNFISK